MLHVLRGGSFWDGAGFLRSAYRNRDGPEDRDWGVGFRCVRSLLAKGPREPVQGPRIVHWSSVLWDLDLPGVYLEHAVRLGMSQRHRRALLAVARLSGARGVVCYIDGSGR